MISKTLIILVTYSLIIYPRLWAGDDARITGRGPLEVRNQFPLSQVFLSFTADNAIAIGKNNYQLSLNYSHANTFAQSPGVLKSLNRQGNRTTIAMDSDGKVTNPNSFILDTGTSRLGFNFKYGISERFNLELDVPYLGYHGGFLDAPIEFVHQLAGFPYSSRAILMQNTSQFLLMTSQKEVFYSPNNFATTGIGDIVLLIKGILYNSNEDGFSIASRIALKFPTGNYSQFHGSGSLDYGLDITATKKIGKSLVSTSISGIMPGAWKLLPEVRINPNFSWTLSYEYLWGNKLSLILQNLIQSSYMNGNVHPELSKPIFEWTAGLKYDIGSGFRLSFAITENYLHHNNTADFGFHFGLSRIF
jgi:hypothetical protein